MRIGGSSKFARTAEGFTSPIGSGSSGLGWEGFQRKSLDGRTMPRRTDPKHLRLPTTIEITRWLAEVRTRRGPTKALACRTVLETGMRLEETVLLRRDQLPDLDGVACGMPARMDICYGTKGARKPGDATKIGKSRTLRFEVSFLQELSSYASLRRAKAVTLFKARHADCPVPPQLFLSERTGEPITPAALYKAWHACEKLPYQGFSPHAGRHTFACLTLLRLLREETELIASSLETMPRSTLMAHAGNLIDTYIRPTLGHVSETTTNGYLSWIADHVSVAAHRNDWSEYLDDANA
jgi:integrase